MARDATGCCEGPDPHGRGVLRRAPKGPVPKLAAKALTAPLFLAAILRLPVVNLGALIHPHTYKVPGRMQAGLISELPRGLFSTSKLPVNWILGNLHLVHSCCHSKVNAPVLVEPLVVRLEVLFQLSAADCAART